MERLHQNLEDYRRQLESSTDRRLELSNYREMIGQREDEIRKQIDKIEVHHSYNYMFQVACYIHVHNKAECTGIHMVPESTLVHVHAYYLLVTFFVGYYSKHV